MTDQQVGSYIRILCHMADKGCLTRKHMLSICKAYDKHMLLQEKFKVDNSGNYYNERLIEEVEKRRNYTQSRRKNAKAYAKHMENENIVNTTTPNNGGIRGELPTLEEVISYQKEINSNVEAEYFFDFYTSNGWMKGKNKIKDWKAAFRNAEKWEKGDKSATKRMLP